MLIRRPISSLLMGRGLQQDERLLAKLSLYPLYTFRVSVSTWNTLKSLGVKYFSGNIKTCFLRSISEIINELLRVQLPPKPGRCDLYCLLQVKKLLEQLFHVGFPLKSFLGFPFCKEFVILLHGVLPLSFRALKPFREWHTKDLVELFQPH